VVLLSQDHPVTGASDEKGQGEGLGYTLNVPMDAYADDADYERAFDEKIVPALTEYRPDFILVSAGFDAHLYDPLGGMKLTKAGFHYCNGKIIFVLEGGYDLKGLQEGVETVLERVR
jgi:acetoin utilization deacetylase AcuC-like enzyme